MTREAGKNSSVSNALVALPFYPIYNENGNLGGPFDENSEWSRFKPYNIAYVNPLIFSRAMEKEEKSLNTLSNLFMNGIFYLDLPLSLR